MQTTIQETVKELLEGSGLTLSTAESCTGGMISHLITSVPGSSKYFLGGVVSYSASVKAKMLHVPTSTISSYGLVSSEVASAMADGVREATGSTFAVSTTGVAGPGPDGLIPEGTVWIGVSGPDGTLTSLKRFHNGRSGNINAFAEEALRLLTDYIRHFQKK